MSAQQDDKCREAFEREYFANAPKHASERNVGGKLRFARPLGRVA